VEPQLEGDRTLPHYPMNKKDYTIEQKYESRGFVKDSFIQGLSPQSFIMHAMSGRIGVIDTALKTASSGYAQRRIVKVCEDISVKYDGTVRDASGKIIQPIYGKDGLDGRHTVMPKGDEEMTFIDIDRLVDKLNNKVE
jgi:DNA-directed RNA polymerase II subunit RPB1